MELNAEEEKRIAIEKGNYLNGVPFITVIGDGGWAKRSYGHGMNSLSGVVSYTLGITFIGRSLSYIFNDTTVFHTAKRNIFNLV